MNEEPHSGLWANHDDTMALMALMALMADVLGGRTTRDEDEMVVQPIQLTFAVASTLSSRQGKEERTK